MNIRVHDIKQFADGTIELAIHGTQSDANYIRDILDQQKGATVSEPTAKPGTEDAGFLYLSVKGTPVDPLPVWKVKDFLVADQEIDMMPKAIESAEKIFQDSRKTKTSETGDTDEK